jgi:UDP-N-acetyl-D-glucosamine/UDP-N-acetyl-D-galactosamine dehydrogenase
MSLNSKTPIAIIGLGYVGLPLAVEFAKVRPVIGFDINAARIAALQGGHDATLEVEDDELRQTMESGRLRFTTNPKDIADCPVYIVTVPTPITEEKRPDLRPLLSASKTVGQLLKPGDIVIYESTVYPGCTEEDCVPILERESGLAYISAESRLEAAPARVAPNVVGAASSRDPAQPQGFHVGYSPERINPGDKAHRVSTIKKITSGSTPKSPRPSTRSTARSSSPARTRPRASRWPKPPRSSRTPSATSTSR